MKKICKKSCFRKNITGCLAVLLFLLLVLAAAAGFYLGPQRLAEDAAVFKESKGKELLSEKTGTALSEGAASGLAAFRKPFRQEVVVLDAGHQGSPDSSQEPIGPGAKETKAKVAAGTTGVSTGVREYELNLEIALQLEKELTDRGYRVVMVRNSNDVNISNVERAQLANEIPADAFIRIHANGCDNPEVEGAMTICPTPENPYPVADWYTECRRLSECILDAYVESTGCRKEKVLESDVYSGINWCQVPVTIVEMGYMTSPEEDERMQQPGYQKKMVQGIADGIDQYFAE